MGLRRTVKDCVYGMAVGDALGVPYEFKPRGSFECTDMVGHGTHNQPSGTRSDDTSMALALCDSYRERGRIDCRDMLAKFRKWINEGAYTADGNVFDYDNATKKALDTGQGLTDECSKGNGSLMRCLPMTFMGCSSTDIREVSAITHANEDCMEACEKMIDYAAGHSTVGAPDARAAGIRAAAAVTCGAPTTPLYGAWSTPAATATACWPP